MIYPKEFCIILLLIDFVDTSFVSGATCTANGDVYIPSGDWGRGLLSEGVTFAYAGSEDHDCANEQLRDALRIYGCQKSFPVSTVDIYFRIGRESLLIVGIRCITHQPHRRRLTRSVSSGSPDLRRHRFGPGTKTHDLDLRHRRQDVQSGEDALEGEVKHAKTSVSFEVKLNFSSNDEISIDCDPEGLGILYISNPNPDLFKSLLAFSEFTRRECNTEFYNNGRYVAIGGCSLNMPVIASFSVNQKHAPVIGGAHSNFKVYKINCSEPEIQRGMTVPGLYGPDSGVAGNRQPFRLVAIMAAVVFMTEIF